MLTSKKNTEVTRDIVYKQIGDEALRLDVYEPDESRGAVVLIHGGGWFQGDKAKDEHLASLLANESFLVLVPNYRLAPKDVFPAARTDVIDAMEWALKSPYQFDRTKLTFWGSSAGGNLSVEAALLTGRPSVSWSGPLDLQGFIEETDGKVTARAPSADFGKTASAGVDQGGPDDSFLRWVILRDVGGDRTLLKAATTVLRAVKTSGPVYMVNSLAEFIPIHDALTMQKALADVGVESTVHLLPGSAHGEGYLDEAISGSLEFVQRVLDIR